MDICIMMCRLNKITPRNKMRKREVPEPDDEVEQRRRPGTRRAAPLHHVP
jgi:hypothetical protein